MRHRPILKKAEIDNDMALEKGLTLNGGHHLTQNNPTRDKLPNAAIDRRCCHLRIRGPILCVIAVDRSSHSDLRLLELMRPGRCA